jgi:hypothetical protein
MAVVDHDKCHSPRAKDAVELLDAALGVLDVVDHPMRVDEIEGLVGKWQVRGRSSLQVAWETLKFEATTRELKRCHARVDRGVSSAVTSELHSVSPDPAPDLEDIASCPPWELGDLGYVRLERIAVTLNFSEELRTPSLVIGEPEAGLIGGPEI